MRPVDRPCHRGAIRGPSEFARFAQRHTHKRHTRERSTADVAGSLVEATGPVDAAVRARDEHLCMTFRGVRAPADSRHCAVCFRDDPRMVAQLTR
ncbi:GTP cyclohydrolase I [Streptomyces johnsoniae]|uniref:GTP cyclohydrolase I n=1 Tax=Streptomyces johnsoniae TaxID=3075532 RepID=UPI00374E1CB7